MERGSKDKLHITLTHQLSRWEVGNGDAEEQKNNNRHTQ
ncbi:hypothetical protein COO91_07365 [Nostoc flagelliforme CCNUN1]|uniref:Uncharacterized protein n=1 Tax=Nostoc flagelliforme CCNUN1 TaxID=2038116 RepID=A0A2K8T0U4_9NOSO|nr:hypothetical protein COO91_07365 [Nostoc flagelliforme CCNUN1]